MTDITKYRFLRVLEYVGTREALDRAREARFVKGCSPAGLHGGLRIFEAILGETSQPLEGQFKKKLMEMVIAHNDAEPGTDLRAEAAYDLAVQEMLTFLGESA